MSLCTGGGTKRVRLWNQAGILSALNPADKRNLLLLKFIFFDIKVPCHLPDISLISPIMAVSRPTRGRTIPKHISSTSQSSIARIYGFIS